MKKVLTELEAAAYIGMSRSFLAQDRMLGQYNNRAAGPKYIKIGRSIRYLMTDLDSWLTSRRVNI